MNRTRKIVFCLIALPQLTLSTSVSCAFRPDVHALPIVHFNKALQVFKSTDSEHELALLAAVIVLELNHVQPPEETNCKIDFTDKPIRSDDPGRTQVEQIYFSGTFRHGETTKKFSRLTPLAIIIKAFNPAAEVDYVATLRTLWAACRNKKHN